MLTIDNAERGEAAGSSEGVGIMGLGGKGKDWLAGIAGDITGVVLSGGSIPAARREAIKELSPPPVAGIELDGG